MLEGVFHLHRSTDCVGHVAGIDMHVVVSNFIVSLTSPPDARYSPLTKPAHGPGSPTSFDTVRALVLPITSDAVVTKVTQPLDYTSTMLLLSLCW